MAGDAEFKHKRRRDMKVLTRTTEERLDELRAAYERLYDRFNEVRFMLKAQGIELAQLKLKLREER
jgi:phosphoserine phosphatase